MTSDSSAMATGAAARRALFLLLVACCLSAPALADPMRSNRDDAALDAALEELRNGAANCPCVSTTGASTDEVSLDASPPCLMTEDRAPGGDCLPEAYGRGECRAWDRDFRRACAHGSATTEDKYNCDSRWCYVDPNNCDRPSVQSFYLNHTHVPGGLHFSYATCGYADPVFDRVLRQGLGGKVLRVSYPHDSSLHLKTDARTGWKTGTSPALLRLMAGKYLFNFTEVPIAPVSRRMHPETNYTACVHSVAINETDLCAGPFWVLPERAAMASFAESFEEERLYLATAKAKPSTKASTPLGMLGRPFLPFSYSVWAMLIFVVSLSSVAHAFLEELRLDPSSSEKDDGHLRPLSTLQRVSNSVYFSFHSFLAGSTESRVPPLPLTPAAQILHTGFSFFVLVVITTYTANLVSFLVPDPGASGLQVESLAHAIQHGFPVCGPEQLESRVLSLHPGLLGLYVPRQIGPGHNLLDDLDAGLCAAAIMAELDFKTDRSGGGATSRHCDKVLLKGEVLLSFNLAWPVLNRWEILLNAATVSAVTSGEYARIRKDAERILPPPPVCTWSAEGPGAEGGGAYRLLPGDMVGIVFLYILCILGALATAAASGALARRKLIKRQLGRSITQLTGYVDRNIGSLRGSTNTRSHQQQTAVQETISTGDVPLGDDSHRSCSRGEDASLGNGRDDGGGGAPLPPQAVHLHIHDNGQGSGGKLDPIEAHISPAP